MVWTAIPLPFEKDTMIGFFVGAGIVLLILSFFIWEGNPEMLLTTYNFVFWIFFALFWGIVGLMVVRAVLKKLSNLFQ